MKFCVARYCRCSRSCSVFYLSGVAFVCCGVDDVRKACRLYCVIEVAPAFRDLKLALALSSKKGLEKVLEKVRDGSRKVREKVLEGGCHVFDATGFFFHGRVAFLRFSL